MNLPCRFPQHFTPHLWLALCLTWLAPAPPAFADGPTTRFSEEDYQQLATRLAALTTRMSDVSNAILRMRQADDPGKDADARAEQLAAIRTANEEKRQLLQQLPDGKGKLPQDSADSARQLNTIETQCNDITQKIAELKTAGDDKAGVGFSAGKRIVGKEVLELVITRGRLVPLCPPYFQGTRIMNGGVMIALKIDRVKDGVAVDQAIKDGDLLDQIIKEKKADPKTCVFKLFVCTDSIGSFHQLRQVVSRKGYSYGWDTWMDKSLLQGAGGGGDGGIDISQ